MALTDNLIAWWTMDEASGASRADSSGNGNTLTNNGTVGQGTGIVGYAASYDGTAANYLSNTSALVSSGAFSVACWVNITTVAVTFLWEQEAVITPKQGLGLLTSTDRVAFRVTGSNDVTTAAPSTGAWHHLAGTYDGSSVGSLYVDGSLANSASGLTYLAGATSTQVGGFSGAANPYTGLIDLLGLWSRALGSDEVLALYNGGAALDFPFASPVTGRTSGSLVRHRVGRKFRGIR